jgi:S1-C subfamily serine protease
MNTSHRLLIAAAGVGAAASTFAATALGGVVALDLVQSRTSSVAAVQQAPTSGTTTTPQFGNGNTGGGWSTPVSPGGSGSTGGLGDLGGSTGTSGGTTGTASSEQVRGVVDIVATENFGQGEAAGTGIILTSNGRVLTNNHVVEGSTSLEVTDLSTGKTYEATVVGTSPTNDVAVIQLKDASGLATATLGDSDTVSVGDAVTGVGNAGNEPGTSASTGVVTALGQSITASDQGGGNAEDLTGLIQTNAGIRAGDSGGPLYDASGKVVGVDTAAQTSARSGQTVAGYAVPINHALDIAEQIVAGVDNETIHQGVPAFLGVRLSQQFSNTVGAAVAGVIDGSGAASTGLSAGDIVTALDGKAVNSADALRALVDAHEPGDSVSITWTDVAGAVHSQTVTLGAGPAD